jgi:hypothetical protein
VQDNRTRETARQQVLAVGAILADTVRTQR